MITDLVYYNYESVPKSFYQFSPSNTAEYPIEAVLSYNYLSSFFLNLNSFDTKQRLFDY